MSSPNFSELISRRPAPVGTLITSSSTDVAEVLAACGFDWFFLDLEHGALDAEGAQRILQVAQSRVPVIVRIPENSDVWVKKALDIGSDGIIVPMVNSAEEARRAVKAAKYPPLGSRSVGIARAHGFGPTFAEYVSTANTSTSVIVQVEHVDAVENIESIVSVEGLDGIFIGPYDLSGSLGCLGDVTNPKVQEAIGIVRAACKTASLPVGIFGLTAEVGRACLKAEYDFVAVGIDLALLASAGRAVVEALTQPT